MHMLQILAPFLTHALFFHTQSKLDRLVHSRYSVSISLFNQRLPRCYKNNNKINLVFAIILMTTNKSCQTYYMYWYFPRITEQIAK